MKAEPIYPFEKIRGGITKDHYCRILNGKQIVQRKPDRSHHIKTPLEAANQQQFAALYRSQHISVPYGDH